MHANQWSQKKYDLQYAKDKLKRIPLDVKKEKYEEIKAAAEAAGEPINGYIKKAIDQRIEWDAAAQGTTQQTAESPSPKPPTTRPEKRYKPFTDADATKVDFQKLQTNLRYQMDIADAFGMNVLAALMEKARQQPADSRE